MLNMHRFVPRLVVLSTICLVDPIVSHAQVTTSPEIASARTLAQELVAGGLPGLSAAVAVGGDIVWSEGFGFADIEHEIPMTRSTRIRVGSTAKSMTAFALVQLVDEGLLNLDAPIQAYVPSFPAKPEGTITPRLLAGNLSGIRHYQRFEFASNRPYPTVESGLAIFQDDPLVCAPGERFAYSTYGWTLLAAAMEGASGEDYLTLMNRRVFQPLTMNATGPDYAHLTLAGRATCYERQSGSFTKCAPVDNSYKWAGGGFLSHAEDLVRLGMAVSEPGLLSPQSLDLLLTSQSTTDGEPTGYGLGWFVGEDDAGNRICFHSGGSVGGTTILLVRPAEQVVVALASNVSRGPLGRQHADQMADLFR